MSRTQSRTPDVERVLQPARRLCPACGQSMRIRYENRRTLVTLSGTQRLRLKIRRCEAEGCGAALVDLTKNRSRRFCDASCANRTHAAAYRARRQRG